MWLQRICLGCFPLVSLFWLLFLFCIFRSQRKSGRVSHPLFFAVSLLNSSAVLCFMPCNLPCFVPCLPQSLVHCSLHWSFSAWWPSYQSRQWFGFCNRGTVSAPPSSRRSSTTLRSKSWIRTGPAWWRLRRPTACHRRTFSLSHNGEHEALLNGWVFETHFKTRKHLGK